MSQFNELLVTFIAYIVIIFIIGYFASRVTKNIADYVLGGRRLSGPIAALGVGASDMSGWLLLALPGAVYLHGINQIWLPIGLSIGAFLNWQLIAKRLRIYTEIANDSLTIPAFFDNRFQDKERILRAITAVVIIVFFTFYTAAGFVSGAVLAQTTFSYSFHQALLVSSAVIIVYTCIGGFLAVSWIDFFQGALMFFALILVPAVTFNHLGGFQQAVHHIGEINLNYLNAFNNINLLGVLSLLTWGLGYFGQPHILVRFMAAKRAHDLPQAQFICMFWMVVSLYGAICTGLAGIYYFKGNPIANHEAIFLELSKHLFNPWLTGILMAAVLSAVMSTIAAQLLASASALVEDFYHGFLRKQAGSKELLWVSRIGVIVVALIALLLALNPTTNILNLVGHAWAGLGASFGPVIIFSLFWPRMTRNGAIAGMLTGAITVIVWHSLNSYVGGIFKLYEMLPACLLNSAALIIFSLIDQPPSVAIQNEFKQMQALLRQS